MANQSYVCVELVNDVCQSWAVHTSIFDELAITPAQAGQISIAVVVVLVISWSIGEIGRMIKNSNNPFG